MAKCLVYHPGVEDNIEYVNLFQQLLGKSFTRCDNGSIQGQLITKYYTVELTVEFVSEIHNIEAYEACVIVVNGEISYPDSRFVLPFQVNPEQTNICVLLSTIEDVAIRQNFQLWCLDNSFELIHLDENIAMVDRASPSVKRILEGLECTMWKDMVQHSKETTGNPVVEERMEESTDHINEDEAEIFMKHIDAIRTISNRARQDPNITDQERRTRATEEILKLIEDFGFSDDE